MTLSLSCVTSPVVYDSSAPTPHASDEYSDNVHRDSVPLSAKNPFEFLDVTNINVFELAVPDDLSIGKKPWVLEGYATVRTPSRKNNRHLHDIA